jgi:hypothetical protein
VIAGSRLLATCAAAVMLAACAGHTSSGQSNTSNTQGSGQCNEPCVLFHVQINFSGLDGIQGSFVDNSSGSGDSSCAQWASGSGVGWVLGPGTPTGTNTVIDGKSLSFGISVTKDKFHGPGTYSTILLGGGVTIGADTFFGTDSSETLNADGSGKATFSDLVGGSTTGTQGSESGTVTWTCSK